MPLWMNKAYAAGEIGTGLPQFNQEHFSSQIFWAVISFIILLLLLYRYVLPVLSQVLNDRAKRIKADLDNAQKQREDAEQLLLTYQQQLAKAHQHARKIIDQAHSKIIAEQRLLQHEFEKKIQRHKDDFKIELAYAKTKALKDIHNIAVSIAITATSKLIAHRVTKEEADQMVILAIKDLERIEPESLNHIHIRKGDTYDC
ncbi:MAG: hypothetical protein R8M46_01590 [Ghiorsea sp.]